MKPASELEVDDDGEDERWSGDAACEGCSSVS